MDASSTRQEGVEYRILPLDCCSAAARVYSNWIEQEWVREPICDWLESGSALGIVGDVQLPIVYSAIGAGDKILGAAAIVRDEVLDRPQWNPWLGLVYVDPPYRNSGIGLAVVHGLLQASDTAGINELYLFCPPQLEHLYRRFNFKPVEAREYDGVYAITMTRYSEIRESTV